MKSPVYRRYASIRKNENGYNAFISFTPLFPCDLPTVNRVKVAIDLWFKFHMNYKRFIRYFNFLTVTNPRNYNRVWGKLITVTELRKLAVA